MCHFTPGTVKAVTNEFLKCFQASVHVDSQRGSLKCDIWDIQEDEMAVCHYTSTSSESISYTESSLIFINIFLTEL